MNLRNQTKNHGNTSESSYVLFFGLVRKYKGLKTLINSMKYNHNFKLLIVGEFYDNKKIFKLDRKVKSKKRLILLINLLGMKKSKLFLKSKAVILAIQNCITKWSNFLILFV